MPREPNSSSVVQGNEVRSPPLISILHAFDQSIATKTPSTRESGPASGASISKALKTMCEAKSGAFSVSACQATRRK